jgi:hypothetical protein
MQDEKGSFNCKRHAQTKETNADLTLELEHIELEKGRTVRRVQIERQVDPNRFRVSQYILQYIAMNASLSTVRICTSAENCRAEVQEC